MKIYYSMVLLTPKQFIDKFESYDAIILGATDKDNIIGLSNDFYVDKVLPKVTDAISNLQIAARKISINRTLWLISKVDIDIKLETYLLH